MCNLNKKRLYAAILILFIAVIAIFFYYYFNPEANIFFPKCPFFILTGYKCPGCGSQRAIHALLHLNFISAFKYNALVSPLLLYAFLIIAAKIAAIIRGDSSFLFNIQRPIIIWAILVIIIAYWIGRNIYNL